MGNIKWSKFPHGRLKILGVIFENEGRIIADDNWEKKVKCIELMINNWNRRKLSIMGKIIIVKNLLISQIVNLMMITICSDEILKIINTLIFKFIWHGNGKGSDRVKRNIITQEYEKGGLKMIDAREMQKGLLLT